MAAAARPGNQAMAQTVIVRLSRRGLEAAERLEWKQKRLCWPAMTGVLVGRVGQRQCYAVLWRGDEAPELMYEGYLAAFRRDGSLVPLDQVEFRNEER